MSDEYLTPKELADRWKITPATLANWRARKTGIQFVKLGDGPKARVLYRMIDVKFFERRRAA